MHKFLFYNKFIIRLYMFRALCAHHQVKLLLHSIWYHHTCRWPSGAQVERVLSQPVHQTATYFMFFLTLLLAIRKHDLRRPKQ